VGVDSTRYMSFDIAELSLGVEEEYLIIDPATRMVVPQASAVVESAASELGERVSTEVTQFQIEAKTEPCTAVSELRHQLQRMRTVVADAAHGLGFGIVASGTPVLGEVVPPPITDHPRYEVGVAAYRGLHDEQSICAGHIHVHLPDRERAVLVSNHLRPWLPVLIAMWANSPFWEGRDTGYASLRSLAGGKWPVAGPPPYFACLADFEEIVGTLTAAGVLVDRGTIFWDIRLSARLPTLEMRVTDVSGTAAESALLAALVRALVMVALADVQSGDPGPRLSGELLRAAYWRAARDGLDGHGIDAITGRLMPAPYFVEALLSHVGSALDECGDLGVVRDGLRRLRVAGTGAARQRAAYAKYGQLTDVVDFLAEQTVSTTMG
jgi:glutamate---cysteine ligase / carboxylate-amine ligase